MKFVLVNGRTPRPQSFCALCCKAIGESGIRRFSVEDHDFAGLDLAHPGHQGEQGGLSNAVGPDHSHHAIGRNIEGEIVEREPLTVAERYPLDPATTAGLGNIRHTRSLWRSTPCRAPRGTELRPLEMRDGVQKARSVAPAITQDYQLLFRSRGGIERRIGALPTLAEQNWSSRLEHRE